MSVINVYGGVDVLCSKVPDSIMNGESLGGGRKGVLVCPSSVLSLCDWLIQVNIVPIIAKADSLTAEECQSFKKQVSEIYCMIKSSSEIIWSRSLKHFSITQWKHYCAH